LALATWLSTFTKISIIYFP